ncbi:MAG: selenocysteine-specific translation elongation factor [Anaerolineaceae bacterium]
MHIVGTAGHVDHGKSTLVTALTGVNPDRLKEEIAREMTIDLGFASMTLPDGEVIGIIDVPGHLHFIGNMLSGIGGIDAVLLVIAADEGVSAQTREHLAILDLLGIDSGLIVLTKIDLVDDPEWLELVQLEALELVKGTSLEAAPVVAVSAHTGEGLDELTRQLATILKDTPTKVNLGRPRLPVDRVFTLTGFGTVVTGTLIDGGFSVGDEVVIQPSGLTGRVRGLQNHKHKLQHINPGFRAAININGVDKDEIRRGDVITLPGTYQATNLLDVHFRLLPGASLELTHDLEVKTFIGAAEIPARVRLLGREKLEPGAETYLQLKLENPTIASRGDRFVLRLPSPSETIGGGVVLDAHPKKLYRRFDTSLSTRMQSLLSGNENDLLLEALTTLGITDLDQLSKKSNLPLQRLMELMENLLSTDAAVELTGQVELKRQLFSSAAQWHQMSTSLTDSLATFHAVNPLKLGTSREQLRVDSKLPLKSYELTLEKLNRDGQIRFSGIHVALASHKVALTPEQMEQAKPLLYRFFTDPYTPPDHAEAAQEIGGELLEGLVGSGRLVAVSDQILFSPAAVEVMTQWVRQTIESTGSLSLGQFRDYFNTSRKYAAAFLEYLDSLGITVRKNDIRLLKQVK